MRKQTSLRVSLFSEFPWQRESTLPFGVSSKNVRAAANSAPNTSLSDVFVRSVQNFSRLVAADGWAHFHTIRYGCWDGVTRVLKYGVTTKLNDIKEIKRKINVIVRCYIQNAFLLKCKWELHNLVKLRHSYEHFEHFEKALGQMKVKMLTILWTAAPHRFHTFSTPSMLFWVFNLTLRSFISDTAANLMWIKDSGTSSLVEVKPLRKNKVTVPVTEGNWRRLCSGTLNSVLR
jgi:hypothetical protein